MAKKEEKEKDFENNLDTDKEPDEEKDKKKKKIRKKNKNKHKDKKEKRPLKLRLVAILKIMLVIFVSISIIFIAARTIGGVTLKSMVNGIKIFFSYFIPGDGYPYKMTGEPATEIFEDGWGVFLFSKDKTVLLSSSAKELAEIPVEYGKPAIKYKNGKAVVYDRDSGKFRLQSTSEIIFESELKTKITAAGIGSKGNFALASCGTNSKTTFTVFNKKQEEVFKWSFSEERVTDIDLSDDGKFAVVSTVKSKDALIDSKVYVFTFDSENYVSCFDLNNAIALSVKYDNAHNISVVTDKGRSYIEDNSTIGDFVSFESDVLYKRSENEKSVSAVALKRYGSDSFGNVKIFNGKSILLQFNTETEIKDVYCSKKHTAVLTASKIFIYNQDGELQTEIPVDSSAQEIMVSGKKVYYLTPVEVVCVKF